MVKRLKGITVLVTGSEGFIGSHLSRRLYRLGAEVHIIVRPKRSLWRITDLADKVKIWPVDLFDARKLGRTLSKVKPIKIYHLAANTNHERSSNRLFNRIFRDNFNGTLNLINAAKKVNFDCFVNTGTSEEYGMGKAPFEEGQRECPVSPYSASKVCITHICQMLHRSFDLPIVTLRPFLTYGPGQNQDMFIPSLILSCIKNKDFKMTSGRQTRELNYVDDIVEGFIKASITPEAIGEVINLGNGREYRIIDIARMIRRMVDSKAQLKIGSLPYRKGEAMRFYSSPQKAKRILKWHGKVKLEEGLNCTIDWYKKYHNFANYL